MRFFVIAALLATAACDVGQKVADDAARSAAKGVVTPIVREKLPGVPAEKVTDCVIDNASAGEILSLAKASVVGVTDETIGTVVEIAKRPEAVKCIATASLGGVLA